eukprot:jgi/Botrbrau1/5714/Bobra.0071s0045.1
MGQSVQSITCNGFGSSRCRPICRRLPQKLHLPCTARGLSSCRVSIDLLEFCSIICATTQSDPILTAFRFDCSCTVREHTSSKLIDKAVFVIAERRLSAVSERCQCERRYSRALSRIATVGFCRTLNMTLCRSSDYIFLGIVPNRAARCALALLKFPETPSYIFRAQAPLIETQLV